MFDNEKFTEQELQDQNAYITEVGDGLAQLYKDLLGLNDRYRDMANKLDQMKDLTHVDATIEADALRAVTGSLEYVQLVTDQVGYGFDLMRGVEDIDESVHYIAEEDMTPEERQMFGLDPLPEQP